MTGWTLRRRLVGVLVGLVFVVAAIMAAVSTLALQGSLVGQLDDRLTASSNRAFQAQDSPSDREELSPPPREQEGRFPTPPAGLDVPGQGAGTINLIDDVDGAGVLGGYVDDDGVWQALDEEQIRALLQVEPVDRPQTVEVAGLGSYRVLATTTPVGDLLLTGLSTEEATATVSQYLWVEALVAVLGIAVAALAGGALVRRELRPLERVAATATRVAEVPLHEGAVAVLERVPQADTDPTTEVGQVGTALNRLLGHVESALAARHDSEMQVRQFVADASHELRTPLASIRGYAELVRRMPDEVPPDALRAMERVESESRRMTSLVEDMLLLARLDAGRPLDRVAVDLTALALDAVSDAHAAGADHVWQLDLGDPDPEEDQDAVPREAVVTGDEDRLRQVLVNLLANARVHTPPGTTVVTSVRAEADTVTLTVQDDGPGIPRGLHAQLFQRFARGDEARSPGSGSSGLGLAIVDAVVRAHGGRIALDGTPGATSFTVTLPAAAR